MLVPLALSTSSTMLLLLGGAALILYVAGRFTIGALPMSVDRPFTRALIAAVPVIAISLVGVLMGRPILALHLPIACAAAALTFGLSAIFAGRPTPADVPANRSWALIVPVVAMLLIAALGGRLDYSVLVALVAYGSLALAAWSPDPLDAVPEEEAPEQGSFSLATGLWLLGLVTACVAGVLAMYGADHLDMIRARSSDSLVAVFLLAPAIVLPFFFELLPPCRSIGFGGSVSSLVKFALICICFIVPLVAISVPFQPMVKATVAAVSPATTQATTIAVTQPTLPMSFASIAAALPSLPVIATRADVLVLVGVSLLLIPLGSGWLRAGKLEALALLACYVMNLLLVIVASL